MQQQQRQLQHGQWQQGAMQFPVFFVPAMMQGGMQFPGSQAARSACAHATLRNRRSTMGAAPFLAVRVDVCPNVVM